MRAFWRDKPLNAAEQALLRAVFAAHAVSARRENISTFVLQNAARGSGSYTQALAAALNSLGGPHAPVAAVMEFLDPPSQAMVEKYLEEGRKVPGWGNSFVKGQPDASWYWVDTILGEEWPELARRMRQVTQRLHAAGKIIFPNPGGYTGAAALALGLPKAVAPWLFVAGRLEAWTEIVLKS